MRRLGGLLIALTVTTSSSTVQAQSTNPPGVTEVAPGVREIDGGKVPSTQISVSALKAAIEKDRSFAATKRLFAVPGIASLGPAGTTTYMYKVHDTDTNVDMVAILFVKGGRVLNYLIS